MTSFKYLLLALIVVSTFGLHLKHNYDTQEYLDALEKQQTDFQNQINDLSSSVNSVDKQLFDATQIPQKITILEDALLNQEGQVFDISATMLPPLNLSMCNCQKLSATDKKNIIDQSNEMIKRINNLQKQIANMSNGDDLRFKEMSRNAQSQLFYLNSIQQVLKSNCTVEAILTPTVYQTNFGAQNWITGNLTINDIVNDYIERAASNDNITNCPLDKPFYDGSACITCKLPNNVFNMQTKKCIQCQYGYIVDQQLKECVENITEVNNIFSGKPWITGDGNLSSVLTDYASLTSKNNTNSQIYQLCSEDEPFVNPDDGKCFKCPEGEVYKLEDATCSKIPDGQAYDPNTHNIEDPQQNVQTYAGAKNLLSSVKPVNNPSITDCPKNTPYFDGVACISCPDALPLFDINSQKCGACQPEQVYNASTFSCQTRQTLYMGDPNSTDLVGTPHHPVEDYTQAMTSLEEDNPNSLIQSCEQGQNSDYKNCIDCNDGQYFDVASLKCVTCQRLDLVKKTCMDGVYSLPNLNDNSNGSLVGTEQYTVEDYSKDVIANSTAAIDVYDCPSTKPFSNGTTCMKCPKETPLFNISSLKCTTCPSDSPFNADLNVCQFNEPIYLDNPEKATQFVAKNYDQVDNYFNNQAEIARDYPNPITCPAATPYSNGTNCFACQNPNTLFNISAKNCTNCPSGTTYSIDTYSCQPCESGKVYNETTKQCQKPYLIYISNSAVSNYTGINSGDIQNYFDSQLTESKDYQNVKLCPVQTPFSAGDKCIACSSDTPLYNVTSKSCTKCPDQTVYNKVSFLCGPCAKDTTYNPDTKKCEAAPNATNANSIEKVIIGDGETIDKYQPKATDFQCPESEPFYDGTQCISCQGDLLFNVNTKNCQNCPDQTVFNVKTNKCEQTNQVSNLEAGGDRIILPAGVTLDQQNKTLQAQGNLIVCQQDKPFFNGQECIDCQQDLLFNYTSRICTSCPTGTKFNAKTNQCQKIVYTSNLKSSLGFNWFTTTSQNYTKTVQNSIQAGAQLCPKDKPFATGTSCINCADGTSFNVDTRQCDQCPAGQIVDSTTKMCAQASDKYITPLTAPNLLYGGMSPKQVETIYNQTKEALPSISDCPKDKPYFNGVSCIVCTGTEPYFNLVSKSCVNCPQGSTYDASLHICKDEAGNFVPDTSIGKLAANIFAHQRPKSLHRWI